jgi:hypothetical protein
VSSTAGQMERIRARLSATTADERQLRVMLVLAHEALRRTTPAVGPEGAARSRAPVTPAPAQVTVDEYGQLVEHLRATVAQVVPAGARIVVVSRGDERLLVPGFEAGHFPQAPDGRYAGYYPEDSADAVGQLEGLRKAGTGFLVFPATSYWWLDFYGALARHLLSTTRVAHHDEHCLIFDLRAHDHGGAPA